MTIYYLGSRNCWKHLLEHRFHGAINGPLYSAFKPVKTRSHATVRPTHKPSLYIYICPNHQFVREDLSKKSCGSLKCMELKHCWERHSIIEMVGLKKIECIWLRGFTLVGFGLCYSCELYVYSIFWGLDNNLVYWVISHLHVSWSEAYSLVLTINWALGILKPLMQLNWWFSVL